ncbi:hypothetical protein EPN96_07160 [bacterium]|nr:MAG: hypothetical protein EPN96_07160 [bacterium]
MRTTTLFALIVAVVCSVCIGCTHLSAKVVEQKAGWLFDANGSQNKISNGYDLCKAKGPIVFVRDSETADGSMRLSLSAEMDKPIEWVGYTFESTDKDYPADKTKNHISRLCLIDGAHDTTGAPVSRTVIPDTEYCREVAPPTSPRLIQIDFEVLTADFAPLNMNKLKVMAQEQGGKTLSCEVDIMVTRPSNIGLVPAGSR